MGRLGRDVARRHEAYLTYWDTEDGKALKRKFQCSEVVQTGLGLLGNNAITNQSALYRRAAAESGGDPLLARMNLRTVTIVADLYAQDLLSYGFPLG